MPLCTRSQCSEDYRLECTGRERHRSLIWMSALETSKCIDFMNSIYIAIDCIINIIWNDWYCIWVFFCGCWLFWAVNFYITFICVHFCSKQPSLPSVHELLRYAVTRKFRSTISMGVAYCVCSVWDIWDEKCWLAMIDIICICIRLYICK